MKKVFATIAVCGFALAFVACGGAKKEEAAADTTAVAAPDTTKVDTAAADTTKTDTAAVAK